VFIAVAALSCYYGATTAVIHDLTPAPAHGFAFGLYMFIIHFFGDGMAPAIIGRATDRSSLRRALVLGVAANLLSALGFAAGAWIIARRPTHSRS
jgi:MFS family permease